MHHFCAFLVLLSNYSQNPLSIASQLIAFSFSMFSFLIPSCDFTFKSYSAYYNKTPLLLVFIGFGGSFINPFPHLFPIPQFVFVRLSYSTSRNPIPVAGTTCVLCPILFLFISLHSLLGHDRDTNRHQLYIPLYTTIHMTLAISKRIICK
jgi:hypothetical protein